MSLVKSLAQKLVNECGSAEAAVAQIMMAKEPDMSSLEIEIVNPDPIPVVVKGTQRFHFECRISGEDKTLSVGPLMADDIKAYLERGKTRLVLTTSSDKIYSIEDVVV